MDSPFRSGGGHCPTAKLLLVDPRAGDQALLPRQARQPPSIGKIEPVIQAASSEARKHTSLPTSTGSPKRGMRWLETMKLSTASLSSAASVNFFTMFV